MKRNITISLIGAFLSLSLWCNAQTFWREDWKGATSQGQTSYTGPNGAWTVVPSGANGADSNVWYFSNWEEGKDSGECGGQTGPASAHMGFTVNSPFDWPIYQILNSATNPDQGAVIDDDGPDPTNTNQRLESPTINCSLHSTIKLSFNYIEGKAGGAGDEATVWYFNGSTWALLSTPAQLDSCVGGEGHWTYYSVMLPASANNNANVRIGFNWTNNMLERDDSVFDNSGPNFTPVVSFAVDSIVLATVAATKPVAAFKANKTTGCAPDTINFTDTSSNVPTSWKWTFTGGNPATSTSQNQTVIYATPGAYTVKLVATNGNGSDSVTKVSYINVVGNCGAGIENIADNNDISLYPNPANNTVNLSFSNAISGNVAVYIMDITGRSISSHVLSTSGSKIMTMDVSGVASGVYIVKVITGSNIYFGKFIKQ